MKLVKTTVVGGLIVAAVNAFVFGVASLFGVFDGVVATAADAPLNAGVVAAVSMLAVVAGGVLRWVLSRLRGAARGRRLFLWVAGVVFVVSLASPLLGLEGADLDALLVLGGLHLLTAIGAVAATDIGTKPQWGWGRQAWRARDLPEQPTAFVSGITSGIGRATALALAGAGWRVIGVGRSPDKAAGVESAAARLPGTITVVTADVSLMYQATGAGRQASEAAGTPFDAVVHAVGTLKPKSAPTAEGIDSNIASSWLSRVAMQRQLDLAHDARLVNVSGSETGHVPRTMRQDLAQPEDISADMKAHGQAQLANDLWVAALRNTGVAAFGYGPGAVDTDIRRELPRAIRKLMKPIFWWHTRQPEDAAADIVRLLLDDDLPRGGFASRTGVFQHDPFVEDHTRQNQIIQLAERLLANAEDAKIST